jgi:hypothetical protein
VNGVEVSTPPTVKYAQPEVPPEGIVPVMEVPDQLAIGIGMPFKVSALLPWVAPNPFPLMLTCVPTGPLAGAIAEIDAFGRVNNQFRLLGLPLTVTCTSPVTAPDGMVATIWLSLQLTTLRAAPPARAIVLDPFVLWNPEPFTVTCVPITPFVGEMLAICGGGTLKLMLLLLAIPPATTINPPLVAVAGIVATICVSDQLTTVAVLLG